MAHGQLPGWFDRWLQRWMPSPQEVAAAELKDAQLHVLESQTQAEYAALLVGQHNLTTNYHRNRIVRLSNYLGHDKVDIEGMKTVDVPKVLKVYPDITPQPRTEHG